MAYILTLAYRFSLISLVLTNAPRIPVSLSRPTTPIRSHRSVTRNRSCTNSARNLYNSSCLIKWWILNCMRIFILLKVEMLRFNFFFFSIMYYCPQNWRKRVIEAFHLHFDFDVDNLMVIILIDILIGLISLPDGGWVGAEGGVVVGVVVVEVGVVGMVVGMVVDGVVVSGVGIPVSEK